MEQRGGEIWVGLGDVHCTPSRKTGHLHFLVWCWKLERRRKVPLASSKGGYVACIQIYLSLYSVFSLYFHMVCHNLSLLSYTSHIALEGGRGVRLSVQTPHPLTSKHQPLLHIGLVFPSVPLPPCSENRGKVIKIPLSNDYSPP